MEINGWGGACYIAHYSIAEIGNKCRWKRDVKKLNFSTILFSLEMSCSGLPINFPRNDHDLFSVSIILKSKAYSGY